ncbi:MAG: FHA domain-containing protein [Planctomycetaceae bacterium]|nr:FHA domain-containing protein [Planctomycetaceae bacterium]
MEPQAVLGELIPCGGGDPIPLLRVSLTVGRRSNCDISLRFPNVSSQHCQLQLINGYWHLRDLNSRNGIKVNGVRCDQKWLLPGDEVSIAKHRYELVYHPDGDAPPPIDEDPFSISLLEKAGLSRRRNRDDFEGAPHNSRHRDVNSNNELEREVSEWLADDDENE